MMTKPEMTTHKASNNRPRVRSPKRREKHPADQIKARDDDTMRAIECPCLPSSGPASPSRKIMPLPAQTPPTSNPHSPVTQHHPG